MDVNVKEKMLEINSKMAKDTKNGHKRSRILKIDDLLGIKSKKKFLEKLQKEEIDTNCCYANQDKFWVSDPDGHQWEVYYFNHDTTFNDPHYEAATASACCTPPQVEKKHVSLSNVNTVACEPNSGCC